VAGTGHPLTDHELLSSVHLIRLHGGYTAASRVIGCSNNKMQQHWYLAFRRGLVETQSFVYETVPKDLPELGPRETVKYRQIAPSAAWTGRVVYFTDTHVHPAIRSHDHLALIAAYVAHTRPAIIIHGGDLLDIQSLCSHTRENTYRAKSKPRYEEDMEAGRQALETFGAGLPDDYSPRKHITLGNHEDRAWRYEDENPAVANVLTGQMVTLLESHGWTWQRYGHWTMVGQVGFTHAPRSIMGKPLGGVNVEGTIANGATFDIVFGHTHRPNVVTRAKQGHNNRVTVVNGGCSMPPNHQPDYAEGLPTGYGYGLVDLFIRNGRIETAAFRSYADIEFALQQNQAMVQGF